jgi:hypothetical protein
MAIRATSRRMNPKPMIRRLGYEHRQAGCHERCFKAGSVPIASQATARTCLQRNASLQTVNQNLLTRLASRSRLAPNLARKCVWPKLCSGRSL